MGNDEHSQNVYKSATEQGLDPLAYCDRMEEIFQRTWRALDLSYDDFIRTTEPRHKAAVTELVAADLRRAATSTRGCTRAGTASGARPSSLRKNSSTAAARASADRAAVDQGEELFFPAVELPEAAARALSDSIPIFSSPIRAETSSFGCSRAASTTSRSAGPVRHGAFRCPGIPSSVVYVWFDALINYIRRGTRTPRRFDTGGRPTFT